MKTHAALALFAVSAVLAAGAPSIAHADPPAHFVSQDGFSAMDPDRVWNDVNAALPGSGAESVFLPAANTAPVPLALLALEAAEPALERVRYRLRYGTDWVEAMPSGAPQPVSYIEVTRFNLGPAIRQQMVDSIGADAVAGAEEFGVGPHVAWRLVTQPVMGNRAMVVAAGRMELSEEAAHAETCFGDPCLDTIPGLESLVAWSEMEPANADIQGAGAGGVLTPAQAVELLLGEVDSIESDAAPGEAAIADWAIEAVLEANLGQDAGLDGAYRWGGLLDDSVAAIWQRLVSFSMGAPEAEVMRASAYECARGPEFAEPGEYCP